MIHSAPAVLLLALTSVLAITPEPLENDRDHMYETLGVRPDATQVEIKQAYKKLALDWHPDKHKGKKTELIAHEKFIIIGNAYGVLNDPEKREIYDKHGMAGLERTRQPPSMQGLGGLDGLMQQLFGHRHGRQAGDVFMSVHVSLEEVFKGKMLKVTRVQQTDCPHCAGAGGEGYHTCEHCHGKGSKITETQPFPGIVFRQVMPCNHCHSKGHTVESHCDHCHGTGRVEAERTYDVEMEAGVPDRMVLNVPGGGDFVYAAAQEHADGENHPGGKHGDLKVQLVLDHHDRFQRNGKNLYVVMDITLVQSLLGVKTSLVHLDGTTIPVETEKGRVAKHGSMMKLEGLGMPSWHVPDGARGDLFVQFNVVFPDTPDETLLALHPLTKGDDERRQDNEEECQKELALLKSQTAEPVGCHHAGQIPTGAWSAEKVLKSKPEFIRSAREL